MSIANAIATFKELPTMLIWRDWRNPFWEKKKKKKTVPNWSKLSFLDSRNRPKADSKLKALTPEN